MHFFEKDNPLIERNLTFRNRLRNNPEDRYAYESLKKELAKKHVDGMEYCRAKTKMIDEIIDKESLQ